MTGMDIYAAFILARTLDGCWAATTRPADRGQAGRIGLPGGKVEPGEDPAAAALREAAEEGWRIMRHVPDPRGRAIRLHGLRRVGDYAGVPVYLAHSWEWADHSRRAHHDTKNNSHHIQGIP